MGSGNSSSSLTQQCRQGIGRVLWIFLHLSTSTIVSVVDSGVDTVVDSVVTPTITIYTISGGATP